jgi:hypothetical protein
MGVIIREKIPGRPRKEEDMSSTKRNAVEKGGIHVGKDGLSYGFDFTIEGHYVPTCDFCQKNYASEGLQVSLACGLEICPRCIASGPRAVAKEARKRRSLKEAAEVFGMLASFSQLPGGVLALKIAEAHQETKARETTLKRSHLRREA